MVSLKFPPIYSLLQLGADRTFIFPATEQAVVFLKTYRSVILAEFLFAGVTELLEIKHDKYYTITDLT